MPSWDANRAVSQRLSEASDANLTRIAEATGCLRGEVLDLLLRAMPEDDLLARIRDELAINRAAERALRRVS